MYKGKIHDAALKQIYDLANCTQSTLEIKVRSVQEQLNSFDCDLISVAFLVDALDGNNDIGQNHNAEEMRFHFQISTVFVVDRVSNLTGRKIAKCLWLIAANATSGIIANVSLFLKTFLKIVDWTGFAHAVNLVLP